jgi:preprotein translocase subunit SecE
VHEDCTGTRKVVHPSVHQPMSSTVVVFIVAFKD